MTRFAMPELHSLNTLCTLTRNLFGTAIINEATQVR